MVELGSTFDARRVELDEYCCTLIIFKWRIDQPSGGSAREKHSWEFTMHISTFSDGVLDGFKGLFGRVVRAPSNELKS